MARKWFDRLVKPKEAGIVSYLRTLVTGSFYRVSNIRSDQSLKDIKTQIDTMRALARDAQISVALSYYATDATTTNSAGQIIWATVDDDKYKEVADIINALFKRWKVDAFARDHILELATIGNLYIPTTMLYREPSNSSVRKGVVLDSNTIKDDTYDIIPSYKIPPENIIHLWYQGKPKGYVMQPDPKMTDLLILPESACIHFALGGLLGDYTLETKDSDGNDIEYDIQFANPLLQDATQPTQTLNLLQDAILLSSLARTIKFINVDCGTEETEIQSALQMVKDAIEQQLALNTANGDIQSFVNPQSPNNLIYLPKNNGQDIVSVTDLNMADSNAADNALLDYYQDQKLSVLGVPKEALNFSSSEGLGGAGAVLSQRSALYANALDRLETAYKAGWTKAINFYFEQRNMSGFVDKFTLHMNPIITNMATVIGEKRDAALSQAQTFVDLLKSLGIKDKDTFAQGLQEILSEEFPTISSKSTNWNINIQEGDDGGF